MKTELKPTDTSQNIIDPNPSEALIELAYIMGDKVFKSKADYDYYKLCLDIKGYMEFLDDKQLREVKKALKKAQKLTKDK